MVTTRAASTEPKEFWKVEFVPDPSPTAFNTDYDAQVRRGDPVGFHVFGECPSCRHDTSDAFPLARIIESSAGSGLFGRLASALPRLHAAQTSAVGVTRGLVEEHFIVEQPHHRRSSSHVPDGPYIAFLNCKCAYSHQPSSSAEEPKKPEAAIGCGSYWMLQATPDSEATDTGGVRLQDVSPEKEGRSWRAARAAAEDRDKAYENVRANTGKFQTTVAGVLALASVGSFFARDKIAPIAQWAKWTTAALALIALVFTALALMWSQRAASGESKLSKTGPAEEFEQDDLAPIRRAKEAIKTRNDAKVAVAVAVVAGIGGLMLSVLAPDAEAPKNVKFTVAERQQGGSYGPDHEVCGTIKITVVGKKFFLTAKDGGSPVPYSFAELRAVGPSC